MIADNDLLSNELSGAEMELVTATHGKRLANYLIDFAFFYLVIIFWTVIVGLLNPSSLESLSQGSDTQSGFGERILFLVLYVVYIALIEGIFRGKSIGKLITGTKAVNADGTDISFGTAFSRGLSRAVPFEGLSALSSPCYPWHDKWSNTCVIDEKKTRQANLQQLSISALR